jgi:hypothetical protein
MHPADTGGMSSEKRLVERLRPTPLLLTATVMQVTAIPLYAVNASHQRTGPFWGWLPTVAVTVLTATACRQTATTAGLDPATARLWRSIAVVSVLIGLGTLGDARQSVVHPERVSQQQHDLATSACYALAVAVLCWALLRMPGRRTGRPERSARLLLDAVTLGITVSVFAWYFAVLALDAGDGRRITLPMIMLATMALIVALAAVKIAVSGVGGMEPGTLRWFAAGAGIGTIGSGLFPLLVDVASRWRSTTSAPDTRRSGCCVPSRPAP